MNNSSDKILVVARKYNDIFYAISTSEWSQCSKHYLLMITDRLDQNEYPMPVSYTHLRAHETG